MAGEEQKKARQAKIELIRRAQLSTKVDFNELLFDQQRAFVEDPARLKAAVCSRRAGKSEGIAHLLVKEALSQNNVFCAYISLTTAQAKRILWPVLKRLNHRLSLKMKFNENDLTCKLPNGSEIFMVGGSEASELERLRGGKYAGVVIDEAQAFGPFLEMVIDEIILPATMDLQGWIALTGTPNASCAGYFYELTTGRSDAEVSVHHWTAFDNPYIVDKFGNRFFSKWIATEMKKHKWEADNPVYKREWLGQWIRDEEGLVYKIRPFNLISELPAANDWCYVLGIDLGFKDSTAFVVQAYSEERAQVVTVESYKQAGLIPSVVAAHVLRFQERYDFEAIVADTGGFGKGYVEEMKQRYGIPIQAAEKTKKNTYIENLNGDLLAGVLYVIEKDNISLISEANLLQWRADAIGKPGDLARKEDPRFENHSVDAWLYSHRYCRQWLHDNEENPPERGTPEWAKAFNDQLEEEALKSYRKQSANWWEATEEDESSLGFDE